MSGIEELLEIVPKLLELFLPGYLFVAVYGFFRHKKYDVTLLSIASIIISYLIKCVCTLAHLFFLKAVSIPFNIHVLIYCFLGVIIAICVVRIQDSQLFYTFLLRLSQRTITEDVLVELIDDSEPLIVRVFLKNSEYSYVGQFWGLDEKKDNAVMVFFDYTCFDLNNNEVNSLGEEKSLLVIPLREINRMEYMYDDNSKKWARLMEL